ncbi:hypothetical protein [Pelagicoccus sp. SDUM812003]|uniref:hypothetical protein n=1 Tax=Pelagicoccus sp. SDUM812003 TaxID=3041267 RepID=UPI00280E6125|nr:hypothetical protein [Pelagicoccus sp. SDUM812003]MDQ8203978.1 hypothetical protein [Pelagicoccus sp. SDUM812003]
MRTILELLFLFGLVSLALFAIGIFLHKKTQKRNRSSRIDRNAKDHPRNHHDGAPKYQNHKSV